MATKPEVIQDVVHGINAVIQYIGQILEGGVLQHLKGSQIPIVFDLGNGLCMAIAGLMLNGGKSGSAGLPVKLHGGQERCIATSSQGGKEQVAERFRLPRSIPLFIIMSWLKKN